MSKQQTGDYAHDFREEADGSTSFRCSLDAKKWRWLTLHPSNAMAMQSGNYYALTAASHFRGRYDPDKWTAMTDMAWRIGATDGDASHPVWGRCRDTEEKLGYEIEFYDAKDRLVYFVTGAGVVFENRDFEGWRQKNKSNVLALPEPTDFTFAAPADVGVNAACQVFTAPISEDGEGIYIDALMTRKSGFPPSHPVHDGSGDHVNTTHLCDVVQQGAHQIHECHKVSTGGKARFSKYVELDRPFRMRLKAGSKGAERLDFAIEQAGAPCAVIALYYDQSASHR